MLEMLFISSSDIILSNGVSDMVILFSLLSEYRDTDRNISLYLFLNGFI